MENNLGLTLRRRLTDPCVCLGFSASWASEHLHYRGRSKLIPLLIRPKLDVSRQGLAFVLVCAAEHYDERIWMDVCVCVRVFPCICTHKQRCLRACVCWS